MLPSSDLVAFVASTDLERSRAFYEGILGFAVRDHNPGACVIDANGTTLRVTMVGPFTPLPFTVLGWEVDDIERAVREISAAGVHFEQFDGVPQDEAGIWIAPGGDRVAWFKDPDGNVLSVSQHVR